MTGGPVIFGGNTYTGGNKTTSGITQHFVLAYTSVSNQTSPAMAYAAIYETTGVKLVSSNNNYGYGYVQTETISSAAHGGNYATTRHGLDWSNCFTITQQF